MLFCFVACLVIFGWMPDIVILPCCVLGVFEFLSFFPGVQLNCNLIPLSLAFKFGRQDQSSAVQN